ncbi:LysE family translocator [Streptoalloteichus hindustanus]|uniref:Threonine/homoserine/homoserine lactone efflux protein n=1 Tax=Streptoalloteichus hindustanus TaxID=2017 RepID=A0A1M5B2Q9_STRHI|nr:LysE family translocator [Streptoalloteichus hindustanus]SHF36841.1 Threonine/homoserine/homoserine lactone efflux protein [Streptoalloteichus hindustanus]
MPDSAEWLVFLSATLVFAAVPGPGMLYVIARALSGGWREGVRSVVGTAVGATVHVVAAAAGLSALLATSATAFTVVKLVGAAYLLYLGVRALLAGDEGARAELDDARERRRGRATFLQGVLTEVLNPKTALFFLAFIPHFVHPERGPAPLVFAVLGVVVVAAAMLADLLAVAFAGPLGQRMARDPRWRVRQRVASGLTMIGLGGALALAETG